MISSSLVKAEKSFDKFKVGGVARTDNIMVLSLCCGEGTFPRNLEVTIYFYGNTTRIYHCKDFYT